MKSRIKILVTGAVAGAIAISLIIILPGKSLNNLFEKNFNSAISKQIDAIKTSGKAIIRLSEITPFNWDQFYVAGEDIKNGILFPYDRDLLIFKGHASKGSGIEYKINYVRELASFEKLPRNTIWSPENAVFEVIPNSKGAGAYPMYYIVPTQDLKNSL